MACPHKKKPWEHECRSCLWRTPLVVKDERLILTYKGIEENAPPWMQEELRAALRRRDIRGQFHEAHRPGASYWLERDDV